MTPVNPNKKRCAQKIARLQAPRKDVQAPIAPLPPTSPKCLQSTVLLVLLMAAFRISGSLETLPRFFFFFSDISPRRARGIQHQQLIATCPSDQLVTCCSVVVSGVAAIRWIWWLAGLHLLIPGGDLSTCCFQLRWQSLLVV